MAAVIPEEFTELEREIIRERVKAGLANAKRHGRKVGRPRAMLNIVKVYEMATSGLSARAIAKAIGVSDYKVHRILGSREKTHSADAPSNRNDSAPRAVASLRE